MSMMKTWIVFFLLAAMACPGWGRTVGLWDDGKSYITDGMIKTLHEAGWQTVVLSNKTDLASDARLSELDVLFLPGGHNALNFADFSARRSLVKFVAGGKGILAGAFRSGYVRTANRPLFPQVGAVYNRVNGPTVWAYGDSELARVIDKPFYPGGRDHLAAKVGPLGKVFAVSGDDPVGVYGEPHGGRYLVFGAFIGMDAGTNAMQGTGRRVLLKSMDWLAGAPKPSDAEKARRQAEADLEFLRRELLWDWTLNERGPDTGPGVLPAIRDALAIPLESRQFTLEYMSRHLSGKQLSACRAMADDLKKGALELDGNFRKAMADMTAKIGRMTIEELTADNPVLNKTNLLDRVNAAAVETGVDKRRMLTSIAQGKASARDAARFLHGGELAERLMPAAKSKMLSEQADKAIAGLRPAVRAAKAAKLAEERARDLASVPVLAAKCSSPEPAVRLATAKELGRIGGPAALPALIRLLNDPDAEVRINAILGLGWAQSKEAVPELIRLAGGKDLRLRRRAIQALGQIGDERAIKPLLALIGDPDYFTAENAILALGWLKARAAGPALSKIVGESDRVKSPQRGLMFAAIQALGHIGDPSAIPLLEAAAQKASDFPLVKGFNRRIQNIYSSCQSLGVQGYSELAVAEIKAGGRAEVGIRQAEFLSASDKFYGLTGRFNALAGRVMQRISPAFEEDPTRLWPYLREMGFSGIHMAWGTHGEGDPERYAALVEAAGELGLLWIDILPVDDYLFGGKVMYGDLRQHGVNKAGAELVLFRYRDMPAFQGFWWEETYPGVKSTPAELEAWLALKYGADFREALGEAAAADLQVLAENKLQFTGPLQSELLRFKGEKMLAHWRESQEWLHGVRKGCAFTFSVSHRHATTFPGVAGGVGNVIDAAGPETYQCFGRDNAFLMEMHKDGERRPVMCEFYNWYSPSSAHDVRGFAQHLMHGECFYNFHIQQIFSQVSFYMWTWAPERANAFRQVFGKARAIREYLDVPASAANVALLCSEMTACRFGSTGPLGSRWYQHQSALWTALQQSQIPADVIWAETMTAEKLARYRVLLLLDGRMLTRQQAGLLRAWVRSGGVLVSGGATSLFDDTPAPMASYALSDVFGVAYAGLAGAGTNESDTFGFVHPLPPVPVQPGLTPESVRDYVHRDVKPEKSLARYTLADKASERLPGMAPGTACEYDMPLGYDDVNPGSAEVLATFANGDPALTFNSAGKGACYFWTPIYPGLCHVTSGWEMDSNIKAFWPNVRELLAAMVRGGLAHANASLPVEVSGVGVDVEVTVREQPEKSRWMVHLLDYDVKSKLVRGAAMTVRPPAGKAVKRIFYPDTGTEVRFAAAEGGVTAGLRDFEVHDMAVVEWKTGE